jgi:hypothetical protein
MAYSKAEKVELTIVRGLFWLFDKGSPEYPRWKSVLWNAIWNGIWAYRGWKYRGLQQEGSVETGNAVRAAGAPEGAEEDHGRTT